MKMEVNGTLVRRAEQDYWEYFNLKKMAAADEQNGDPAQWLIVRPYSERIPHFLFLHSCLLLNPELSYVSVDF